MKFLKRRGAFSPPSHDRPPPPPSPTRSMTRHQPVSKWIRPFWETKRPKSRRDYAMLLSAALLMLLFSACAYKCVDMYLRWSWLPKYQSRTERDFRSQRFPSVDDRVRIYMTNWYNLPCEDSNKVVFERKVNDTAAQILSRWSFLRSSRLSISQYYYEMKEVDSSFGNAPRTVVLNNQVQIGKMFTIDKANLQQCFTQHQLSIRFYCRDSETSILNRAMPDIGWASDDVLPILCQFSDETDSFAHDIANTSSYQLNPTIPHIKKIRFALSRTEIDRLTLPSGSANGDPVEACHHGPREAPAGMSQIQPILWLLNINRHFKYSWDVTRYDVPWTDKRDAAVFRGLLTGLEYNAKASDDENCRNLIRCRLVLETANSKLVDAKLTSTFNKVPEILHGVNMTGPQLLKENMLEFKGNISLSPWSSIAVCHRTNCDRSLTTNKRIVKCLTFLGFIILEGNDVSSGLKWAMVSHSVVLMPKPRFTSWSMEELLEPWVHYIPLKQDLSDVEEKTQWMLDHQAEAQRISHRAKLWVLDLYYHPDAMKDNRKINQEVLRRYRKHFRQAQT